MQNEMSALGHERTHALQQTSLSGKSVGALTAPHFQGIRMPVEEPSTTSIAAIPTKNARDLGVEFTTTKNSGTLPRVSSYQRCSERSETIVDANSSHLNRQIG